MAHAAFAPDAGAGPRTGPWQGEAFLFLYQLPNGGKCGIVKPKIGGKRIRTVFAAGCGRMNKGDHV